MAPRGRGQIPAWAAEWVGVPYVAHGRDRAGVDCWGLVRAVLAERQGLELPSYREGYDSPTDAEAVQALISGALPAWAPVPAGEEREGDAVLLRVKGRPSHVGVVVAPGWMLHVTSGLDATVERYRGPRWARRVLGFYRATPATAAIAATTAVPDPGLRVVALRHPFSQRRIDRLLPAGPMLAELVASTLPDADPAQCVVRVDDVAVPRADWATVRPAAGQAVAMLAAPANADDPNDRQALMMLVMVASIATGQWAALGVYAPYAAAAVAVGGALAVNALLPLPTPDTGRANTSKESPTLSVSGTANRATPYGPVWRLFGRHRIRPPLAAKPFVEIEGDDQWFNVLLDAGYGPLALSDFKIGETPLENFQETAPDKPKSVEIDWREGRPDDEPLLLFRQQVDTQPLTTLLLNGVEHEFTSAVDADELHLDLTFAGLVNLDAKGVKSNATVVLEAEYRAHGSAGPWLSVGRLPSAGTATASVTKVDQGVVYSRSTPDRINEWWEVFQTDHRVVSDFVRFRVEGLPLGGTWHLYGYCKTPGESKWRKFFAQGSEAGHGGWKDGAMAAPARKGQPLQIKLLHSFNHTDHPPSGWAYKYDATIGSTIAFTERRDVAVRRSIEIRPDVRGQYDVRIQRVTEDSTDWRTRDECTLTALRTVTYDAPTNVLGKHSLIALRIRATDQLQGMLDQFSCVASSILPVYDPVAEEWYEEESANPAWCSVEVLKGAANKKPVADSRLHLEELTTWAEECAAAGREFNGVFDFRTTVFEALRLIATAGRASHGMRDGLYSVVRDVPQTVPVQHFTARNSRDFSATKTYAEQPHAVKVQFVNAAADWMQDERIVYADGYDAATASVFEELQLFGVTSAEQAWSEGRYRMAVARLRPETYSRTVDIENLVCTRGDLVRTADDVLLVGLAVGRITAVTVNPGGAATALTLDELVPMAAGTTYCVRIRRADLTSVLVTVVTAPGETAELTLTAPLSPPPEPGDLVLFGESGKESMECLVQAIEPQADFSARLTLVPAAPGVHTADEGEIPPYDPLITQPPEINRGAPAAPTLGTPGTETEMAADGTTVVTVVVPVTLAVTPGISVARLQGQVRPQGSGGGWTPIPDATGTAGAIRFPGLVPGLAYELRIRAVGANDQASAWVSTTVTVAGDTFAPAAPTGFEGGIDGQVLKVRWHGATESDWSHYLVSLNDDGWDPLNVDETKRPRRFEKPSIDLNNPSSRTTIIRVKSVDTTGNKSDESSTVVYLPEPAAPDVASLQDVVDHVAVVLLVDAAEPHVPGWVGWLFQYRQDEGGWISINSTPAPQVTFPVPISLGQSATIEWRYAAADIFGCGAWSGPTPGVLVTALGQIVDVDRVDTGHIVPGALSASGSVRTYGATGTLSWDSWTEAQTIAFTPASVDSVLLVGLGFSAGLWNYLAAPQAQASGIDWRLLRDATQVCNGSAAFQDIYPVTSWWNLQTAFSTQAVDVPGTTDEVTYTLEIKQAVNNAAAGADASARWITLTELKR